MRILRVVHRLYPPTVGGLSFHAHMLSARQAELGHQVVVLTTQEKGYPRYEYRDGYEIYRYPSIGRPLDNPLTLSLLTRLLRDDAFDILHAHSHLMFTTILAAIKKHLSKKPFAVTNHGFKVERGRLFNHAQDVYLSSLGKFSLAAADCVISLTETERRKTVSGGALPERTIVVPDGVDTDFFRPSKAKVLPNSVLWAGRFVPEKGLRYLIQAARIVALRFPDSKFNLVGEGKTLGELVDLRNKLGLEHNVIFHPQSDPTRILAMLNNCTLFVLPSLSEGLPISILEAMSCGKPVVVTKGIGLEEVVSNAGLYVPPRNPTALATLIERVFQNQDLANRLGQEGRRRTVSHYDWNTITPRINALFTKIVDNGSGKGS